MPHRDNCPNAGGNKCVCMSNTGVSATIRMTSRRRSSMRPIGRLSTECPCSVNERLPVIVGIGPTVIRHERRPAGTCRILIVPVVAQFAIERRVAGELLLIEADPEARPVRDADRPVLVLQLSAFDDVVSQVVI